jgi:hypothetical protein
MPVVTHGCRRYVDREDFTFENARKAAGNVAGLCDWVKAMCTYHNIAKFVAPKTDALRKAEQSLLVANKKLSIAMDDLTECQRELDAMQAKFDAAKAEKQRLQARAIDQISRADIGSIKPSPGLSPTLFHRSFLAPSVAGRCRSHKATHGRGKRTDLRPQRRKDTVDAAIAGFHW